MHLLKKFSKALVATLLIPAAMNLWAKDLPAPQVLASIKPLQLISQAITDGVSDTEVLLPAGASPHHYSLRVSDRKKIDGADIVLWIGPDMETFLGTVLEKTQRNKAITMMDIAGISQRKEHEAHHHHHHHHDHGDHHHSHGEYDPHIWLNPDNAVAMAKKINERLQQIDKNEAHKRKYASNLHTFERKIKEADRLNKALLADVKEKPFFVFHDAYGHLQDHYGLHIAGYFTISPQQQPGAKHLEQIRKQLQNAGSSSIFTEPQFQPAYIDRLIKDLPVKVGVLDPLGSDIAATPDGYIHFLNSLVGNIHNSLAIPARS